MVFFVVVAVVFVFVVAGISYYQYLTNLEDFHFHQ